MQSRLSLILVALVLTSLVSGSAPANAQAGGPPPAPAKFLSVHYGDGKSVCVNRAGVASILTASSNAPGFSKIVDIGPNLKLPATGPWYINVSSISDITASGC
ncbi:MAG: hypothetical protein ABI186_09250 [Candidatus Elarobacter sp.]